MLAACPLQQHSKRVREVKLVTCGIFLQNFGPNGEGPFILAGITRRCREGLSCALTNVCTCVIAHVEMWVYTTTRVLDE